MSWYQSNLDVITYVSLFYPFWPWLNKRLCDWGEVNISLAIFNEGIKSPRNFRKAQYNIRSAASAVKHQPTNLCKQHVTKWENQYCSSDACDNSRITCLQMETSSPASAENGWDGHSMTTALSHKRLSGKFSAEENAKWLLCHFGYHATCWANAGASFGVNM